MKKLLFMSVLFGTQIQFQTLNNGESLTLAQGVNWVSVTCADCDLVMGGDTMNLTNEGFEFWDIPNKQYNSITIISNADNTKIAYKYENY